MHHDFFIHSSVDGHPRWYFEISFTLLTFSQFLKRTSLCSLPRSPVPSMQSFPHKNPCPSARPTQPLWLPYASFTFCSVLHQITRSSSAGRGEVSINHFPGCTGWGDGQVYLTAVAFVTYSRVLQILRNVECAVNKREERVGGGGVGMGTM